MKSRKYWLLFMILVLGLTACGGEDEEEEDETSPVPLSANAGVDFTLNVGEIPTFDGCASTGAILNYQWTILEAPEAKASDVGKVIRATESNCRFTLEDAMVIEEAGTWVIELEVRGEEGDTAKDSVTVTVETP